MPLYSNFPEEYFTLLDRFTRLLEPGVPSPRELRLGPFPQAEALSSRTSLYRFRNALKAEIDQADPLACSYADSVRALSISIEKQQRERHTGEPVFDYYLVLRLNALTEAIRSLERNPLC